jgi:putative transposase
LSWGCDQSFSAVGSCYDNAAVESFFATLKRELAWIHARTNWSTRAALRSAVFDYIEGFYNPDRIQERLRYRSPIDFEAHACQRRLNFDPRATVEN